MNRQDTMTNKKLAELQSVDPSLHATNESPTTCFLCRVTSSTAHANGDKKHLQKVKQVRPSKKTSGLYSNSCCNSFLCGNCNNKFVHEFPPDVKASSANQVNYITCMMEFDEHYGRDETSVM